MKNITIKDLEIALSELEFLKVNISEAVEKGVFVAFLNKNTHEAIRVLGDLAEGLKEEMTLGLLLEGRKEK